MSLNHAWPTGSAWLLALLSLLNEIPISILSLSSSRRMSLSLLRISDIFEFSNCFRPKTLFSEMESLNRLLFSVNYAEMVSLEQCDVESVNPLDPCCQTGLVPWRRVDLRLRLVFLSTLTRPLGFLLDITCRILPRLVFPWCQPE